MAVASGLLIFTDLSSSTIVLRFPARGDKTLVSELIW